MNEIGWNLTLEEANKEVFIPKYNAKFGLVPKKRGNLPRKLTKIEKERLDQILSRQEKR